MRVLLALLLVPACSAKFLSPDVVVPNVASKLMLRQEPSPKPGVAGEATQGWHEPGWKPTLSGSTLEEAKEVCSSPEVIGTCERWISQHHSCWTGCKSHMGGKDTMASNWRVCMAQSCPSPSCQEMCVHAGASCESKCVERYGELYEGEVKGLFKSADAEGATEEGETSAPGPAPSP